MYKDVLRALTGVDIFPVFAFVIFFAFFLGLLIYVVRMKKSEVNLMASMPLQEDEPVIPRSTTNSQS